MVQEVGIVKTTVTGNLLPDKVGFGESLINSSQLHFGYYQARIVAITFINFKSMFAIFAAHQIPAVGDDTSLS